MLLGSLAASFRYGLAMIAAPETTDTHDDWDAATAPVHAGPDSLYVSVRPSAMGLVKISVFEDHQVDGSLLPLFSGRISLPSSSLMLTDPDDYVRLVVPVESNQMLIDLYCDDVDEPSELAVYVSVAPEVGGSSHSG